MPKTPNPPNPTNAPSASSISEYKIDGREQKHDIDLEVKTSSTADDTTSSSPSIPEAMVWHEKNHKVTRADAYPLTWREFAELWLLLTGKLYTGKPGCAASRETLALFKPRYSDYYLTYGAEEHAFGAPAPKTLDELERANRFNQLRFKRTLEHVLDVVGITRQDLADLHSGKSPVVETWRMRDAVKSFLSAHRVAILQDQERNATAARYVVFGAGWPPATTRDIVDALVASTDECERASVPRLADTTATIAASEPKVSLKSLESSLVSLENIVPPKVALAAAKDELHARVFASLTKALCDRRPVEAGRPYYMTRAMLTALDMQYWNTYLERLRSGDERAKAAKASTFEVDQETIADLLEGRRPFAIVRPSRFWASQIKKIEALYLLPRFWTPGVNPVLLVANAQSGYPLENYVLFATADHSRTADIAIAYLREVHGIDTERLHFKPQEDARQFVTLDLQTLAAMNKVFAICGLPRTTLSAALTRGLSREICDAGKTAVPLSGAALIVYRAVTDPLPWQTSQEGADFRYQDLPKALSARVTLGTVFKNRAALIHEVAEEYQRAVFRRAPASASASQSVAPTR